MTSATPAPPPGRYGRAPSPVRRRAAAWALAVVALAGLGLAVWLGLGAANTPVRWKDVGYDVVGPERVDVTFEVTMAPGTSATCTIQALAPDYSQVGIQDVPVGPADASTTRYTVPIPTSQRATTGVVVGCTPS